MAENKQEWIDANKLEIDFTNTMVVFHDRCTMVNNYLFEASKERVKEIISDITDAVEAKDTV